MWWASPAFFPPFKEIMALYKNFKTNKSVEAEGIWVDFGDGERIRIARAGGANQAFQRAAERIQRKYRKQIQLDTLNDKEASGLLRELYADTIILGWEGVKDAAGKPLPFSKEACMKLLEDLPDFFREIKEHATSQVLFLESTLEADAKN